MRGLVGQWLRTAVHEPLGSVLPILAQWWRTGPRPMAALFRTAAADAIDVRLAGVQVPVVVVRGTRDRLCPHDWAVHVAASAPQGRLVEFPGAAHMTPQTHPVEVAALLLSGSFS